jgi:hypothetical protein
MEWRGLPYPAAILAASKYKLVHSVDQGPNTGPTENGGKTAREVYRDLRTAAVTAQGIAEVFRNEIAVSGGLKITRRGQGNTLTCKNLMFVSAADRRRNVYPIIRSPF